MGKTKKKRKTQRKQRIIFSDALIKKKGRYYIGGVRL